MNLIIRIFYQILAILFEIHFLIINNKSLRQKKLLKRENNELSKL